MPRSHQEMFYPVGCACPAKPSVMMSSSASFTRVHVGSADFVSRPLVLRHSDKRRVVADLTICFTYVYHISFKLTFHWLCDSHVIRAVLTHATIEEIEAEKSLIEDQAVSNHKLCIFRKALLSARVLYL